VMSFADEEKDGSDDDGYNRETNRVAPPAFSGRNEGELRRA